MKMMTIVGARPQFIKAAAIATVLREDHRFASIDHVLVHSGQHHDPQMSEVFFQELGMAPPAYNLGVSGGPHGAMTGRMMESLETILADESPDWVLVYGDTNTTLAAALVAAKMSINIAHVEAGLRSFNRAMPEEINRLLTDHVSSRLFCPTETAVKNLANEGITRGVEHVGDVMLDVSRRMVCDAHKTAGTLTRYGLHAGEYLLATIHRAENTNVLARLKSILRALSTLAAQHKVILPIHPRTKSVIKENRLGDLLDALTIVGPLSFMDMLQLEKNAAFIVTDSGGVQKEAYFYGVPCITMRDETEWVETIETGWNILAGANTQSIVDAVRGFSTPKERPNLYGDGRASELILQSLLG